MMTLQSEFRKHYYVRNYEHRLAQQVNMSVRGVRTNIL